jgi:gliding motility-associated-like protein
MVVVNVATNFEFSYVLDDLSSGLGVLKGNVLDNDIFPIGAKPSVVAQTIIFADKGTFTIDKNGKYTWSPVPGFLGSVQIPIRVCDGLLPERCYVSIVTCITLRIDDNPIPNYISPNGDGSNDVWNIDGVLAFYPNAKAIIYNRWGNIVWRSTGPYGRSGSGTNVWYGQKEGSNEPVPDGVYYYILELKGFSTIRTGFIEVMRQ